MFRELTRLCKSFSQVPSLLTLLAFLLILSTQIYTGEKTSLSILYGEMSILEIWKTNKHLHWGPYIILVKAGHITLHTILKNAYISIVKIIPRILPPYHLKYHWWPLLVEKHQNIAIFCIQPNRKSFPELNWSKTHMWDN